MTPRTPVIRIEYPTWVGEGKVVDWNRIYATDEERMRLAIAVSRENVERETGGPFGAAIFQAVGRRSSPAGRRERMKGVVPLIGPIRR